MMKNTNNYKNNNANTVTDKAPTNYNRELLRKLVAEFGIDVKNKMGDIEAEVPVLSGNTINITLNIGDVTVAERGGVIGKKDKKKKSKKKAKKSKK